MDDQYERISRAYHEARKMPASLYYEAPSVRSALGEIRGRSVIDFACGEGFYTRLLKEMGASNVLGVDLSAQMIALAQEQERANPVGVDFVVADAAAARDLGRFDMAAAIFLFNYARDAQTLDRMVANVAHSLVDGGRLVAVVPNPDYVNGRKDTLRYGYYHEERARHAGGIDARMVFTEPCEFVIEYTQWSRKVYEDTLQANGFSGIGWRFFEVSSQGLEALGAPFWSVALENPKSVILTATKAAGADAS